MGAIMIDRIHFSSFRLAWIGILVVIAGFAGFAAAGDAAPPSVTPPKSDPPKAAPPSADAQAVGFVRMLGDDDPAIRHKAEWRLRDIGFPALPALREAANSDDPQVQTAARAAIKAIGVPLPEQGNGPYTTRNVSRENDYFSGEFCDGKRVVRIEGECKHEGETSAHHIKMTFTGTINGKETTQVFTAVDEEALKWDAPYAWKFYHGIYNHESEMAVVRVPNTRLVNEVNAAMDKLKFSAAERKQVRARLARFSEASAKALAAILYEPKNAPQKMEDEYRESDSLRKYLTEKKLPIVEGRRELGPPPEARLGIYFQPAPKEFPAEALPGLYVGFVATGDRADRIGVRAGDVIQRIDGNMFQPDQLREACKASAAGKMTIDVYRNGHTITLHEKPDGAPTTKP
jgi:hypothetical protein